MVRFRALHSSNAESEQIHTQSHIAYGFLRDNFLLLVEPRVEEKKINADGKCAILSSSCNTWSDAVLNGVRIVLRLRFGYHRCEQLSLSKRAVENASSVHPTFNSTVGQHICGGKNRIRSVWCAYQHHAPLLT